MLFKLHKMKIAIIGVGHLGLSLLKRFLNVDYGLEHQIFATRRNQKAVKFLQNKYPEVHFGTNNEDAVKNSEIVFLATKKRFFFSFG